MQRKGFGWVADRDREIAETDRMARRAADLGRDDAVALCTAGFALAIVVGALDEGAALIDKGWRSIRTWDGHGTSAPWPRLGLANLRSRSSTPLAPFATALRIRRCSACRPPPHSATLCLAVT